MTPIELHIEIDDTGASLLDVLAQKSGLSRQRLKEALDKGALWRTRGSNTRRIRRVKTALGAGDQLHLYYDRSILERTVPPAEPVAQEPGYGIWYKPYGMLCQGSKWGDHCTITRSVEKQTGAGALLVHRLDRAATGLIIVASGKGSAAALSELFRQRRIEKHYQAIVHGCPPMTTADPLVLEDSIDGKPARSLVRVLAQDSESQRALLEVVIETGRKHQIRRHLADAGYPIVGDRLFGIDGDRENLQLCAYRLAFTCPHSGEPRDYQLDPARQLEL